ncbi:MAG: hypothetical protein WD272_06210 [Balneolales bacterium]
MNDSPLIKALRGAGDRVLPGRPDINFYYPDISGPYPLPAVIVARHHKSAREPFIYHLTNFFEFSVSIDKLLVT